MMMKHMHEHMMMHRKHYEKAQQAHMMAMGMCCLMTIGIGIAAVCFFKSKSGKEMREHMKNSAMDTAECLKDMVEQKVEKAKSFVTEVKEKAADPGAEIQAKDTKRGAGSNPSDFLPAFLLLLRFSQY